MMEVVRAWLTFIAALPTPSFSMMGGRASSANCGLAARQPLRAVLNISEVMPDVSLGGGLNVIGK